ncbi:MAG: hypothetical protein AUJ04_09015 [Acidobacteria bacterium 13_1_40CM_3_55_6]|nr:MAG: hypothetical protein AUJ04_09015 [Acidobacteria bacterium 13_1_40CM_3_55_6]
MHVDTALTREAAAQAGESLYETRLKSILEPSHNGKLVAIYISTKEFFVGESLIEASNRLRERHSQAGPGEIYIRGIGTRAVIHAHTPRVTRVRLERL